MPGMPLIVSLAWRNVLRNKRRTLLSGLAVGIGLASLMFVNSLLTGMLQGMIRTATDTFLGQGQIHARGFRETLDVEKTINHADEVMKGLSGEELLSAYSPRTVSYAMLSSAANVSSAVLYGIDPGRETPVSMLDEAIFQGKYLETGGEKQILIGSRAAETLEVELGDRVVVTVAQAGTGQLSQELFRVGGIFRFNIREADSALAYVDIEKARHMLGIGEEGTHEIALKFKDIDKAGDSSLPLWRKYSTDGNEAVGWRVLVPQLDGAIELSGLSTFITTLLVFGIVALIIMNTLFMSLYERMYEFGVLRAIGTRPLRMASIIMLEAASLSIISMALGLALGAGLIWFFSIAGIDYVGIEFAGVTIVEPIYTVFRPVQFTLYPALISIFSLAASLYPAAYAARLKPAKAMQRSL